MHSMKPFVRLIRTNHPVWNIDSSNLCAINIEYSKSPSLYCVDFVMPSNHVIKSLATTEPQSQRFT